MLSDVHLFFYSVTRSSYLADLLILRLAGAIGARDYVRRSFSQWAFSTDITQVLSILSQAISLSHQVYVQLSDFWNKIIFTSLMLMMATFFMRVYQRLTSQSWQLSGLAYCQSSLWPESNSQPRRSISGDFFPGWSHSANLSWASVAESGSISPPWHHTTCGQRGGRPKSNHGLTMADRNKTSQAWAQLLS